MYEPLGCAIGNSLEVAEAVRMLEGNGPDDLREVCLALAGMMIALGSEGISYEEGISMAEKALEEGLAYEKFKEMAASQQGDISYIENPDKFEKAEVSGELKAETDGYIQAMDTEGIGITAGLLGAGRETKESAIDASAGIIMKRKIGSYVKKGETIAVLYTSSKEKLTNAAAYMKDCVTIGKSRQKPPKLIVDIIR
jgi:pyrimidine-nucleoside phosphorylase